MSQTTFQIKSINIGKIEQLPYGKKLISTAIRKHPIKGNIFLTKNGLRGDEQAYKDHGGIDKALCVYSYDHYAYWSKIISSMIDDSLFGENITVYGLTEEAVHVGDIFSFGEAIIQVSEPRNPCYKLAKKYNVPTLPLEMQQTGFTGFLCRVLQEGKVSTNDCLQLIKSHPKRVSIAQINRVKFHDKNDRRALENIIELDPLSNSLRELINV
ncbi:MOSC domain-containing protein [Bacillus mycoides]|uniref:Molybdenum cofactor sulphurase n=1 Tax=Bacillus mycoides TaxID=1405 RepID=C2XQ99_BACMY|nr:MOSC domain-containing protein [Bacillus mycoides]EEL72143.1 Molybdenum cofactor sulphurase [Bacillus mycoides]